MAARLAALGVAGVLVVVAGAAWACSPQPSYYGLSPESGRVRDVITVSGGGFTTAVPIEIKWNDVTGPTLGRTTGPNFAVKVTIPDAAPGVYYVIALQPGGVGKAQAAFRVQAEEPASQGGGPGTTAPSQPASAPAQSAPGSADNSQPADQGAAPGGSPAGSSGAVAGTGGAPANRAQDGYSLGAGAPAQPAAARPSSVGAPGGSPAASAASTTTQPGARSQQGTAPVAAPAPEANDDPAAAPVPSQPSQPAAPAVGAGVVAGDLWGGFATQYDSPASSIGAASSAQESSSPMVAGAALLALGLAALVIGFSAAEVSRRRAATHG